MDTMFLSLLMGSPFLTAVSIWHALKSPRARRLWQCSAVLLCASMGCFLIGAVWGTAIINSQGILEEPLFFLIPVSWLLLLSGILSSLIAVFWQRKYF